ncbi:UNVERIFIED_CONTAM: hypothetical protein Sradi_2035800 [Sesamum radiatum]|uniref:Retrotransposon gag domain-containing protein n=1 Tax=Sesamum radiatum TaxID=300843 RepID=A0AAW2THE3_SESRA
MHPLRRPHKPWLNLRCNTPSICPFLHLAEVENYPRLPRRRSRTEALPVGVKVSNLPECDGTGDPQEHLDKFYVKIDWYDLSDAAYCKVFRTILSKRALAWFNQLLAGTISHLEQLTQHFLHHFSMNKRVPKTAAFLFTIHQKENEPLRDYMQRFVEAVHEVPHVNHELLASIIQQNLSPERFKESITGKPPSTMEDLLMRSQKYIRIEESNASNPSLSGKRKGQEEEKESKKKEERKHLPPTGFAYYTLLNASTGEILVVAEQQGLISQWPTKMKDNPRDSNSISIVTFIGIGGTRRRNVIT